MENVRKTRDKISLLISPSYFLNHFKELRLALPTSSLFIFLLEQTGNFQAVHSRQSSFPSHPLDALLEQTRDVSFSQRVHQLTCSVMRGNELNTVDEAIKFLS
jgi:hypothetical protein